MSVADNPWLQMAMNNAWSNATLYRVVKGLTPKAFALQRPGFFPSIARTLNHVYEVDLYYLDALEGGGEGRRVFDRDDIMDATALAEAQAETDMRFARFCRDLTPERLTATCATERQDKTVHESVAAVILHLVQHQIHHRGQAHVQLSHAGVKPPQLDEFYLEFDRAASAEDYWRS
jgi:uncharacterized damage-inducible protein DinB